MKRRIVSEAMPLKLLPAESISGISTMLSTYFVLAEDPEGQVYSMNRSWGQSPFRKHPSGEVVEFDEWKTQVLQLEFSSVIKT